MRKTNSIYSLLIIIQCIIFGASFLFIKNLLENDVPTFVLMTIRFAVGAAFLFALSRILNVSSKFVAVSGKNLGFKKNEFVKGIIAGITLFLAFALQTIGMNTTTPAKSSLFTDLFVVFVPLITMLLIHKRFKIKPLITALLSFIGVVVLMNIFSENMAFAIGDLFSILCGLAFAIHFIVLEKSAYIKKTEIRLNPYNFTAVQLFVVSILSAIVSLFFEQKNYESLLDVTAIISLLFLSIFATAIAYLIQFFAQEKISAEVTSVLSCSEAVFAIIFSLIWGFDKFSLHFIIGAIILIVSMLIASTTHSEDSAKKKNKQ